jgi:hypothetical protein
MQDAKKVVEAVAELYEQARIALEAAQFRKARNRLLEAKKKLFVSVMTRALPAELSAKMHALIDEAMAEISSKQTQAKGGTQ